VGDWATSEETISNPRLMLAAAFRMSVIFVRFNIVHAFRNLVA
jgi:hypothetical protein